MYVYRLRSRSFPYQIYTGVTTNMSERLKSHNAKYLPWRVEVCVWFSDEEKARAFEKYLKSGSGRVFS
ncbi:MAG: GIY-YIG nuclease family protein [Pseudobdellovibrionaceae bacterium]